MVECGGVGVWAVRVCTRDDSVVPDEDEENAVTYSQMLDDLVEAMRVSHGAQFTGLQCCTSSSRDMP